MSFIDRAFNKRALIRELKENGFRLKTGKDGVVTARTKSNSEIYTLTDVVVYTDNIDKTDVEMNYKEAREFLNPKLSLSYPFLGAQPSY